MNHDSDLTRALAKSGVKVSQAQTDRLTAYSELLRAWNRKLNLAGFDLEHPHAGAIQRIFVEPIMAAEYLPGVERMIDVGSGGGSPGIPLAVALGVGRLDLVESRARKATFLREAMRVCGLSGMVLGSRFESLDPAELPAYDLLSVRAVRLDQAFWRQASRLMGTRSMVAWFHGPRQGVVSMAQDAFQPLASVALQGESWLTVFRRIQ